MSAEVLCVWPTRAILGEGPVWDVRRNALWFVDIKKGNLHCYAPGREPFTEHLGGNPSFVLPSQSGGLVIGNRGALHHRSADGIEQVAGLSLPTGTRLNDATVGGDGRIWFGSMDDGGERCIGQIHLYDRGAISDAGAAAVITNGPAITADDRWLYHVDTLAGQIWRFDIGERSTLADGHLFAFIDPAEGTPDGVTLDAEDHLWVGLWGGWAARRYAPDGALVDEVRFPCANVTKLAFGGPDLRTAFATTATLDLDLQSLEEQPLAGGLFTFDVAVPGRPLPAAKLFEGA